MQKSTTLLMLRCVLAILKTGHQVRNCSSLFMHFREATTFLSQTTHCNFQDASVLRVEVRCEDGGVLHVLLMATRTDAQHNRTGENQNLFATLTVRTNVWIVPYWTFQQSMAISTERRAGTRSRFENTDELGICSRRKDTVSHA